MKPITRFSLVFAFFLIPATCFAMQPELKLSKQALFGSGLCGDCSESITFKNHPQKTGIQHFNEYTADGYYFVDLKGPEGTTVTLVGGPGKPNDRGYLILKKKDNAPIHVADLEQFTPGKWVDVAPKEGGQGAYSAFFQPYDNFKSRIISIEWGQWWERLPAP